MDNMKYVFVDPGIKNDPTGIVGIEYSAESGIHVKLAQALKRPRIETLAKTLSGIRDSIKPEMIGIELNNYGMRVRYLLEVKYNIAMIGVMTSANLVAKRIEVMDKPVTIQSVLRHKREGKLKFPTYTSHDMRELITQIEEIASYRKDTGTLTYRRTKNRHDDLFSAFIGAVHLAESKYLYNVDNT